MRPRQLLHIGIGTAIILGALGLGIFTIAQTKTPNKITIREALLSEKNNPVEQLPELALTKREMPSDELPGETSDGAPNATESLVKKIAASILEKNPDGPSLLNGKLSITGENPEALLDAALIETIENFDYATWKPLAANIDITIGLADSSEAAAAYLTSFSEILRSTYRGKNIDFKNPSLTAFSQMADALTGTIERLKQISVPPSLASIHREEIALLLAQEKAYRAIEGAEEDPIMALLALQVLPVVDQDLLTLKGELDRFIVNRNVSL